MVMKGYLKRVLELAARRFPDSASRLAAVLQQGKAAGNTAPGVPPGLTSLPDHPSHGEWVSMLAGGGLLDSAGLHKWLSALFSARRLSVFEDIVRRDLPGFEQVLLFHRVRLDHYRGSVRAEDDSAVLELYRRCGTSHFLHRGALNLVLQQCTLTGNAPAVLQLLGELSHADRQAISQATCMGVMRLLMKSGRLSEVASFLSSYLRRASGETKLYFLELAQDLGEHGPGCIHLPAFANWREVLSFFRENLSLPDSGSREEFERYFIRPLTLIPEASDYMDVRLSARLRTALQEEILAVLRKKMPLSLIRVGDGEAYCFKAPDMKSAPEGSFEDDNRVRELHWWGDHPAAEVQLEIKRRAREAIAGADMLGFPSVYRLIRDRGAEGAAPGADRSRRGLAVVFNALGNEIPVGGRSYTEERVNQIIFTEDFLEKLCAAAANVVVVSCWRKEQFELPCFRNAEFLAISPHTKVRDGFRGEPLYANYQQIDREIGERCGGPGSLVVVGAGLIGKIFIATARARGAVALDAGAVLDYLVGRKTRSVADLV